MSVSILSYVYIDHGRSRVPEFSGSFLEKLQVCEGTLFTGAEPILTPWLEPRCQIRRCDRRGCEGVAAEIAEPEEISNCGDRHFDICYFKLFNNNLFILRQNLELHQDSAARKDSDSVANLIFDSRLVDIACSISIPLSLSCCVILLLLLLLIIIIIHITY